jgi:hypothetical protein
VGTRNFFAPLRTTSRDKDPASSETSPRETKTAAKTDEPSPVVPISAVNLIQLQKHLKNVVKEDFEFCNTRYGTRIITRGMLDFLAVKFQFEKNSLPYSPCMQNPNRI